MFRSEDSDFKDPHVSGTVISLKRGSSLALLSVKAEYCKTIETMVRLQPVGLEKHSRKGFTGIPIKLKAFREDPRIDPVHYVKACIKATEDLRQSESMFVSINSLHKAVTAVTLTK